LYGTTVDIREHCKLEFAFWVNICGLWFAGGTLPQRIASCLEVLHEFMGLSCPVVSSMVVAETHAQSDRPLSIVDCVSLIMGKSEIA
jgi:hypothetical protein